MKLWSLVSGITISALIFGFRWFLLRTDILVGYVWKWQRRDFYPSFDIRNRSGSKTYFLANVSYTKNKGAEILGFDNESLWGHALKPGTISHFDVAPVARITSLDECTKVEVRVRLQNGREIKGQGPGQLYKGVRKIAFALRQWLEKKSLPLRS